MIDQKTVVSDKPKISRVEVYWHTVTYKTMAIYALLIIGVILGVVYFAFPDLSGKLVKRLNAAVSAHDAGVATINARQARFVNLDGKVQVKKVNSVEWQSADYQITLDKGDLIQTGGEGVARVAFADGTTYTVKGDTLVTVEENLVSQDQPTRVGVHIQSGAVDLSTPTWNVPGSTADISFENAVASLRENSRAAVRSDPKTLKQEITVAEGGAEVARGGQNVAVGQWEKVSFPTGGEMSKTLVLAPPALLEPLNLQPIILANPKKEPIHFLWK